MLKIGLLLDHKFSSKYVYDLAQWARQQDNLHISHLIIHSHPGKSRRQKILGGGMQTLASKFLLAAIVSIENKFPRLFGAHHDHGTFDVSELVLSRLQIQPLPCGKQQTMRFSAQDIALVNALKLDLLIKCGPGTIEGGLLQAARLGTISLFHETDGADFAGFWECYHKCPKTGFAIRRVSEDCISEQILRNGSFATKFSFSANQANLYAKASWHFKDILQAIASSGNLPGGEIPPIGATTNKQRPSAGPLAVYLLKVSYRIASKIVLRLINYRQKWGVSFVRGNWRKAAIAKSTIVSAPRGHFWADPFVYSHQGRSYCFIEDYVYKTDRGHIAVLEVQRDSVDFLGPCIIEPFHLSFPFIFEYKGELYMCPESCAAGQIRIYRSIDFPLRWECCSLAMEDIAAVDTMFFEYDKKWWMLTSIDTTGSNDFCSELYLFFADSPLATDWRAHPQNPIRIDSEGGRNAGLVLEGDKIFRMAQRQGFDQYGEGLLMYEITELSETVYVERLFSQVDPSFRKNLLGIHHLSTAGDVTVFDHNARAFCP